LGDLESVKKGDYSNLEVVCNPEILEFDTETEKILEGCLSIPKFKVYVTRPKSVTVKYFNSNGTMIKKEATGMLGRAFQHEIDHLNGVTIFDKSHEIVENDLYKLYLQKKKNEKAKVIVQ